MSLSVACWCVCGAAIVAGVAGVAGCDRMIVRPGEAGGSPPPPASSTTTQAQQNTGQVVSTATGTAHVSIDSAISLGALILVIVVVLARELDRRGLFGLVRRIVDQSHERALRRLATIERREWTTEN